MLTWFYETLAKYLREEDGATAVEYGIMVALIAVIIIAGAATLGQRVLATFQSAASSMP